MCDQDHFEKDRQEYESLGRVTRKQFGIMLGAGMAMMLPKVANPVFSDRIGRERDNAGRHCRLLLRASRDRNSSSCSRMARHLWITARVSANGQTTRRIGLFGRRG